MNKSKPTTITLNLHIEGLDPDHLYTVTEAAAILTCSEGWIRREVMEGNIASQKVGIARMFRGRDLSLYMGETKYPEMDSVTIENE